MKEYALYFPSKRGKGMASAHTPVRDLETRTPLAVCSAVAYSALLKPYPSAPITPAEEEGVRASSLLLQAAHRRFFLLL